MFTELLIGKVIEYLSMAKYIDYSDTAKMFRIAMYFMTTNIDGCMKLGEAVDVANYAVRYVYEHRAEFE